MSEPWTLPTILVSQSSKIEQSYKHNNICAILELNGKVNCKSWSIVSIIVIFWNQMKETWNGRCLQSYKILSKRESLKLKLLFLIQLYSNSAPCCPWVFREIPETLIEFFISTISIFLWIFRRWIKILLDLGIIILNFSLLRILNVSLTFSSE